MCSKKRCAKKIMIAAERKSIYLISARYCLKLDMRAVELLSLRTRQ